MKKSLNKASYNNGIKKEDSTLGILQWFHVGEYEKVEETLKDLKTLGISHLRTGASWADYHTKEGEAWYDWLLPKLAKEVEILPCFLYTPPSIGIEHKTSSPPKGPKRFADFVDIFVTRHGQYFDWVELWNEPNNRSEYDYTLDSNWDIFSEMIIFAAYWSKKMGKKVALGGMSPIDCNWLNFMAQRSVLENIDAVGIHGFPGSFDPHFRPWDDQIRSVRKVLDDHNLQPEIWITEVGFTTWQYDEKQQLQEFIKAYNSSADRVYWYSLYDLSPSLPTVDGFHQDEREYYFGLKTSNGKPKLLYRMLEMLGPSSLEEIDWWNVNESTLKKHKDPGTGYVLITGGAGFIGINLANHLLNQGYKVIIYDNLSRPGVEKNLDWLLSKHDRKDIWVELADIRNYFNLKKVVDRSQMVFHLAAQVAVTTSLDDPTYDFDVNIRGTFNLLEAIRNSAHQPPIVFTSTNKVYGDLPNLEFDQSDFRYFPKDSEIKKNGISEEQPLNFHSPYGNSKGAAEQYVLDYARSFNIKAVVFRMSCIYGPHQFGTEDQGWIAHFLIQAIKSKPIHIYGDGKQVRDILFVEDLLKAFQLAWKNIEAISGQAFNIGGGVGNSISLIELINLAEIKNKQKINLKFGGFRTGDQVYYVSSSQKFGQAVGWSPSVPIEEGLDHLYNWLKEQERPYKEKNKTNNNILHEYISRTSEFGTGEN
ncbi:MAG: GDP-mannose 4,6-dehydratase [Anditalea sp.]